MPLFSAISRYVATEGRMQQTVKHPL